MNVRLVQLVRIVYEYSYRFERRKVIWANLYEKSYTIRHLAAISVIIYEKSYRMRGHICYMTRQQALGSSKCPAPKRAATACPSATCRPPNPRPPRLLAPAAYRSANPVELPAIWDQNKKTVLYSARTHDCCLPARAASRYPDPRSLQCLRLH